MMLAAQVRGLGSRNLVGNQDIINGNRRVMARLGIRREERICGMLGLGYPAVELRNKVRGRSVPLDWA